MEIKIVLDEKTNQLSTYSDKPIQVDDLMTILFTVQLESMRSFVDKLVKANVPEDQIKQVKEALYDQYNAGASNTLYLFIPDKELRPDLTVEAMKEAEDHYMYNQLNRSQRREVDKKTHGESKILRFPTPDNHIPTVETPQTEE